MFDTERIAMLAIATFLDCSSESSLKVFLSSIVASLPKLL